MTNTKFTDIPGMMDTYKVCTCACHGPEAVAHCVPCCDKTYEKYSPELWESIPEIQAALDAIKEKVQTPAMAEQLRTFNENRVWMEFSHEEEWLGWIIHVTMCNNPATSRNPYEFDIWKNDNKRSARQAGHDEYPTLDAAVAQAKELISQIADRPKEWLRNPAFILRGKSYIIT